jgi:hypothetical protein
MKIRYGGDLQTGDFIIIANEKYTDFGWFVDNNGKGTLQYIYAKTPASALNQYRKYEANKSTCRSWIKERYKDGFTIKTIKKCYIYGIGVQNGGSRVVRIENPETMFTEQEDLELYLKSKEILNNLKFPAK